MPDLKPRRHHDTKKAKKNLFFAPSRLRGSLFFSSLLALSITSSRAQTFPDLSQTPGPGDAIIKNADKPIRIVIPTLDKTSHSVSFPAAFWNQHMTSWVEVALCGRPSDFLHETILSVTTTKSILMQSLRDVGFHDADAWTDSVQNFPRIRADRFIMILQLTRAGKNESYSLDELLEYQGWGISTGPYGWMFKGDPERNLPHPATQPADPILEQPSTDDRSKIVRDDPQIALVYKGIQHLSQSFADHPLAYDDWIYPMMRYGRNTKLLPQSVYDSNGDIPVTLTLQKVTEEQFLTQSAALWHDRPCADYILKQLPIVRDIDAAKSELWKIPPDKRYNDDHASLLLAQIEKGYAELDAAWADWSADHTIFETTDLKELEDLRQEAALWKEHMDLERTAAEQLYTAQLATQSHNNGQEIEARSIALQSQNKQPRDYWQAVQKSLDPKTDPRTDWINHVNAQVELTNARAQAADAGQSYGKLLQSANPTPDPQSNPTLQQSYASALARVHIATLRLTLIDINFEISKREGIDNDPDLPKLRQQKRDLEQQLKSEGAATTPQ